MSRKKKKKSKKVKHSYRKKVALILEYYNQVFALLHIQLSKMEISFTETPKDCIKFWTLVPQRIYNSIEAHQLLSQYLKVVEEKLASKIKKQSLAYWLHLYRRISPKSVGNNDNPITTLAVRSSLEAAFQKYASLDQCDKVALSRDIPIENVLKGMLMLPAFKMIRLELKKHPQLVLTEFGLEELIELYNIERLSYEIWRTMAMMRTVGKGAELIILKEEPYFYDTRDDELAELIEYYDSKHRLEGASISGVMFDQNQSSDDAGFYLIPYCNVAQSTIEPFKPFLRIYDLELDGSFIPNFIFGSLALKEYYNSHSYYNEEYFKTYQVEIPQIIIFLGALLLMQLATYSIENRYLIKMFQRAYEGPYLKEEIISDIKQFLNKSNDYLKILDSIDTIDLEKIFNFLSLKEEDRSKIDVSLGGPMKIFVPFNRERFFIDYAWISWILYTFFWGINPSDQNFKGSALESIVNKKKSILPTNPCKSIDGSKKQIDASYELGDFLLIIECKAKGQSFAFERGDIESIRMRKQFIHDSLVDIDTKAKWLIKNPTGLNYDVSKYHGIIPVLVTPFIEFIPSLDKFYWLNKNIARVFTHSDLDTFVASPLIKEEITLFNNIFWNDSKMIIKG